MLSADYLYKCTDRIVELYAELETSVIQDVARRIAKTGKVTATAEWQILRAQESGALYRNIINEVARITKKSEKEVKALFEEAALKSTAYDNRIYKAAGLEPVPLMQSPVALQLLLAGMLKTNGTLKNLTMTTALTSQSAFIQAADLAHMQIASGAMDYNSAIRRAVKSVAATGVTMVDYATGRSDHLEVAVRRATLTGVNQTALQITEAGCNEMGAELVETSAHWGARPDHAVWQGRVFSRKGDSKKYPNFEKATGYGTGKGLGGWNCRHSFFPFFEFSTPIEPLPPKPDVQYNGKTYSYYEATQQQRKIEREIRRWKREKVGMEAAAQPTDEANAKIRHWQKESREFSAATGLPRQSPREQIL